MDIGAAAVGHSEWVVERPVMRVKIPTLMSSKTEQPRLVNAEPLGERVYRGIEGIEKQT